HGPLVLGLVFIAVVYALPRGVVACAYAGVLVNPGTAWGMSLEHGPAMRRCAAQLRRAARRGWCRPRGCRRCQTRPHRAERSRQEHATEAHRRRNAAQQWTYHALWP